MRPLLLFDGDCGFCTWSADRIERWVKPAADVRPWQRVDIQLWGLTPEQCSSAVQWVDSRGTRSGARAVAAVLRVGRTPWPLMGAALDLPAVSGLASVVYSWVAANRHRLPGSTPACALPAA